MEMRCHGKLHGVVEDGVIEVKCRSVFCGYEPGVVVLHRFSTLDGDLIETKRYRDPERMGAQNASEHHSAAVRHA